MLSASVEVCSECSGRIIDAGEELVCSSCGIVFSKEVVEEKAETNPRAIDYIHNSLGGYMGPIDYGYEEMFSRGFSKLSSNFKYLKTVSDFTGRESGSLYSCIKTIERVCEKLLLPKIVMGHAIIISKKILSSKECDVNTAAISAYSIIAACKMEKVTNVGMREIIDAHKALGRKFNVSSLVKLYLDSPIKQMPRNPSDYVTRVITKLLSNAEIERGIASSSISKFHYFRKISSMALGLIEEAKEVGIGGHNPCAVAATAVYAAEYLLSEIEKRKKLITQRDVAVSVNVAEYTVREQFGEIFRAIISRMLASKNNNNY
jgi:transcription initiation factor TFIIIB Brf1 subunit/transcription initiation factor TFIIB